MKPWKHARNSAKKFGGIPEDYIEIHDWFDQTKAHHADMRHRAILHNSFGIYLCEQVFGEIVQMPNGSFKKMPWIINSAGEKVQVRDIGECHVLEDLGKIPSLTNYLQNMKLEAWMGGLEKRIKVGKKVKFTKEDNNVD